MPMIWATHTERRVRERILMEYLTFRRIREQAWRDLQRADESDTRRLENEQIRRDAGSFVLHDYTAEHADLNRQWANAGLQTARAGIEALNTIRHAFDDGWRR